MQTVKSRVSDIRVDTTGVLNVILKKSIVDLDDVIDTFLVAKTLTKGTPALVLVDTRQRRSISSKASRLIARENVPAKHIAKAVIVNSTFSKNFHNFLIRFRNPRFPVRKFTSETEARTWLKSEIETLAILNQKLLDQSSKGR